MIIQRYISKISGPLLDRIDIHIDVPAVNYRELRSPIAPESSADVRARVVRAREIQLDRFARGRSGSTPTRRWVPGRYGNTAS